MIVSLLIGKAESTGVPGKNVRKLLGRPACEYGFIAASNCSYVDKLFVSTDSDEIARIGSEYGAVHIARPAHLATPESLTEDVFTHALEKIEENIGGPVDMVTVMFANNPAIDVSLLDEGIRRIKDDPSYDSAFSVSQYNMFSPARAKRVLENGEIRPFIDLNVLGDISSIRDSQGDCYFVDFSVQIMKRICITEIESGQKPLKWIGRRPLALFNDYGFDIDTEWQFTVIEGWLRDHGYTETDLPSFGSSGGKT